MKETIDYKEINKKAWDKNTQVHIESDFYDVKGFIDGKSSLNAIEIEQVGEVNGKDLLHLQCHFGQDTLSWARLGANVTGVDLSSASIAQAKKMAQEIGVNAQFISDDVYSFGESNQQQFDIVYTSYGVLCWLPDLDRWAKLVAKSLRIGGQFNIVEFHCFNDLLSGYSYFSMDEPDIEEEGTYTENCTGDKSTMVTWAHPLSEVVQSLINAGLTINEFHEYPYSPYNCFPDLEFVDGKGYQLLYKDQQVPILYSIKAQKLAK